MKYSLLIFLIISYVSSIYCTTKFLDCGIPLTRKMYFQSLVVSPPSINIVSDRSISFNIGVNLQNYVLGERVPVNSFLQVTKDGELYVDSLIGDTNTLLQKFNGASSTLQAGYYSFSYKYTLPPLPTGNYTITLVHKENTTEALEIGCLSTQIQVFGLGLDSCSYTSELKAVFSGTAQFLEDNTVIQIGPWGPGGLDVGYPWGTFNSIEASADLVGYAFRPENYVWGIRGTLNTSVPNTFDGYVVIGYRPNVNDYENAQLVYQGLFSWKMAPNEYTPYIFQSGYFTFVPSYFFPNDFPYPLNIGNLGTFTISQSSDRKSFSIASSKLWCRCNCDIGGVGNDDSLKSGAANRESSMSGFRKGTIAIAVVGTFLIIVAIIVIIKLRRSKPRPVVYDDADLMDPQKPDYGTMAINDAFEAQDQEYD